MIITTKVVLKSPNLPVQLLQGRGKLWAASQVSLSQDQNCVQWGSGLASCMGGGRASAAPPSGLLLIGLGLRTIDQFSRRKKNEFTHTLF